jgi:hypothetical protein
VALFGEDEALRQQTLLSLDTVPAEVIRRMGSEIPWFDGLDPDLVQRTMEGAYKATGAQGFLWWSAQLTLRKGRITEVSEILADPSFPAIDRLVTVASLSLLGVDLPTSLRDATEDLDVCPDRQDAGEGCMYAAGSLAALRGDRATWQMWVERNHDLGEAYQQEDQIAHGKEHEALAQALEGIWTLVQDGSPTAALEQLRAGSNRLPSGLAYLTRFKLAEALAPENPRGAIEVLQVMTSGPFAPFAQVRLGQLREQMGDATAAREAYERADELFATADEGLSYAQEAREGLARVAGDEP